MVGPESVISQLPAGVISILMSDSIQNGGNGNGARLLVEGISFEEVGYGGMSLGEGSCTVADDDRASGDPASLGRCGADMDTNATDFLLLNQPTPGIENLCQ